MKGAMLLGRVRECLSWVAPIPLLNLYLVHSCLKLVANPPWLSRDLGLGKPSVPSAPSVNVFPLEGANLVSTWIQCGPS